MTRRMCELHYYNVGEGAVAFSTTRHGGASRGSYGEMNINPWCGDAPEAVAANRAMLCAKLGVDDGRLLVPHQVHGTRNLAVTSGVLHGSGAAFEGVDSLSTNIKNVCVGVSTADCIPVLLYDKAHRAVAAVHAGWRGTAKRIVAATLRAMRSSYLTRPQDVTAVIGPGISLKNFEVGQEVYEAFEAGGFDMSLIAAKLPSPLGNGAVKWHIDLPLCNRLQLEEAGVPAANIVQSGICTYDNAGDFFSARRLGQASGRIYTGIILKQ